MINNGITRDIKLHALSDDTSRLAELLWKASARPPTGDMLAQARVWRTGGARHAAGVGDVDGGAAEGTARIVLGDVVTFDIIGDQNV